MSADYDFSRPWLHVPGRYGYPDVGLTPSFNYEIEVAVGTSTLLTVVNAFDLVEAALAMAWEVDAAELDRVLAACREKGYQHPVLGPQVGAQ